MIKILSPQVLITTGDTQWALAATVPMAVLEAARRELSDFLQGEGSRVVRGNKGMSVLLVFGGSVGEGDDLAEELTRDHKTSVFLLEFGDWARIQQFDGARVKRKKGHPADFLRKYGVVAPGYESKYQPPPITVIGVLEGVTLDQTRRAMPKKRQLFTANSRGVLVNDVTSITTLRLSKKLKCRSFTLFYNREEDTFGCLIWRPEQKDEVCFTVGQSWVNYKHIDSILGETTLDGILRVLDIPRHLLNPGTGAAADNPNSPSSGGTPALESPPDGREDPG